MHAGPVLHVALRSSPTPREHPDFPRTQPHVTAVRSIADIALALQIRITACKEHLDLVASRCSTRTEMHFQDAALPQRTKLSKGCSSLKRLQRHCQHDMHRPQPKVSYYQSATASRPEARAPNKSPPVGYTTFGTTSIAWPGLQSLLRAGNGNRLTSEHQLRGKRRC